MADFYERLKYHMKYPFFMAPPPQELFSGTLVMGSLFAGIEKAVIARGATPFFAAAYAVGADFYLAVLAGSAAVAFCEVHNLPLPIAFTYTESMRILRLPASLAAAVIVDKHRHKVSRLRLNTAA
jgi:hypothetical protein